MQRLVEVLRKVNFPIQEVIPDGKVHRHSAEEKDDRGLAWYVARHCFSPSTGVEIFVMYYGKWGSLPGIRYCTLEKISREESVVINRTFSELEKAELKERNTFVEQTELENQQGIAKAAEEFSDLFGPTEAQRPKQNVFALGFKEKEYFFTSTQNHQVVPVSRFSQPDFLNLLPLGYWESAYPGAGAQRVDWAEATSKLMDSARQKGIFQPRNVRGAGVWNDDKRIVVNMGDHLVVDGKRVELGAFRSRFFYTLGATLSQLHESPLTADECTPLIAACSGFKWLKPDYGFLLAGALVNSRVCGALPVRPHVWLTGGAQTGKSTLFEQLINPIIGPNAHYVLGSTSEAGIRQSLKADAIPVLFDEFETTGRNSGENVHAVVELMRAAWSDSSGVILKGSSSGNASAFQVRFAAIVSSIRTKLTNDADRSRFAILELAPHGNDAVHYKALLGHLAKIDEEYSERLFARVIKLLPVVLANYKLLKQALASRSSQRFGDQYGMLLAGYSILLQDEPLTQLEAESLVDAVSLTDEKSEATVADHHDALTALVTKKVPIEVGGERRDFTIGEAIQAARADVRVNEALQRIGIKVSSESAFVASKHTELENLVFKGTNWSQTWANSLARLPGAKKNLVIRLFGKSTRGTEFPLSNLD